MNCVAREAIRSGSVISRSLRGLPFYSYHLGQQSLLHKLKASVDGAQYSSLARRSQLMAQFEKIKEQYQDYILLFQVGDFYEIYGDDASKQKNLLIESD